METFGILDFLKPLLALSQNTPASTPSETDKGAAQNLAQNLAQNPEREWDNKQNGESTTAPPDSFVLADTPTQNAAVSFLETHEARAKRLRKK